MVWGSSTASGPTTPGWTHKAVLHTVIFISEMSGSWSEQGKDAVSRVQGDQEPAHSVGSQGSHGLREQWPVRHVCSPWGSSPSLGAGVWWGQSGRVSIVSSSCRAPAAWAPTITTLKLSLPAWSKGPQIIKDSLIYQAELKDGSFGYADGNNSQTCCPQKWW